MSFQRSLPVVASIGIILLVAVLRERSRTVAAVVATMPINVPLALWVVASGLDGNSRILADFMRAALISLAPSILWLGIVFLAFRADWGLWPAIGMGYAAWLGLLAGLFFAGVLQWPR